MKTSDLIDAALDLVLPRVCLSCERMMGKSDHGMVCGLCWARLAALPRPLCSRCGHPVGEDPCAWCANLPPHVRSARSFCWYPGEVATRVVVAIKYGGWSGIAEDMGQRMARLVFPDDVFAERPVLVPVPLAAARERDRGYNQSSLLAFALGRRWGLRTDVDSLRRGRSTVSQTRLTPAERAANVRGAFLVAERGRSLAGQHVMLVDDVVTTAATLNECATALLRGGARTVSYVTFGRARAPGDPP